MIGRTQNSKRRQCIMVVAAFVSLFITGMVMSCDGEETVKEGDSCDEGDYGKIRCGETTLDCDVPEGEACTTTHEPVFECTTDSATGNRIWSKVGQCDSVHNYNCVISEDGYSYSCE